MVGVLDRNAQQLALVGLHRGVAAAGGALMSVQVLPSCERAQVQERPEMPPSRSVRVAANSAPTCGCSEESESVPASSSLVTVTVTGSVAVLEASAASTVTS